jgi:myosin heavy subunit
MLLTILDLLVNKADSQSEEAAAVRIQSSYRGYRTRKELKNNQNVQVTEEISEQAITDLNLDDPEVELAAVKIQAGFRGHKTRKELKNKQDKLDTGSDIIPNWPTDLDRDCNMNNKAEITTDLEPMFDTDDPDVEKAATKIQAGFRGHKARKDFKNRKQNKQDLPEDTYPEDFKNKHSDQELAATKIQAGYRGHKARKVLKNMSTELGNTLSEKEGESDGYDIDIDLDDAEAAQAATKIQAGFRGHKARQEVKKMKNANETLLSDVNEEDNFNLNEVEANRAATKIQAGFRGHKTRKELKHVRNMVKDNEAVQTEEESVNNKIEENKAIIDEYDENEADKAATKIQAGFRGHKARKEIKQQKVALITEKDALMEEAYGDDAEMAATKIQAGFRGHKARKELKRSHADTVQDGIELETKSEASGDYLVQNQEINEKWENITYGEDAEEAATKIQAGFRGSKVRKEFQERKKLVKSDELDLANTNLSIDLEDPEVEKAATKIQAGFRGHKTRKNIKENKEDESKKFTAENVNNDIDIDLDDPDVEKAATKIQAGFRGLKTRKEIRKTKQEAEKQDIECIEEKTSFDIDLDDPETEKAATKIQAGFRGLKARKELKGKKNPKEELNKNEEIDNKDFELDTESSDLYLGDPDAEKAATKIQAGYRGMKTRKEIKTKNQKQIDLDNGNDSNLKVDYTEEEKAATKIQAGYRGHRTRKELQLRPGNEEDELSQATPSHDEELNVDIDLDDPDVEKAATKIQAGFRGHKVRKEIKAANVCERETNEKYCMDDADAEKAATKIQAGFRGYKTRKDLKNQLEQNHVDPCDGKEDELDNIDIDLDDPEVEKAATKIQASFRGMKTRQNIKHNMVEKTDSHHEQSLDASDEQCVIDIDMEDPDVEKAATKIQAGFRGLQTRKQLKGERAEKDILKPSAEPTDDHIDIDLEDPEVEKAATKIQAGFRGLKTRKQLKTEKEGGIEKEMDDETSLVDHDEDKIDIDLEDPDVERAATKIQAGFRGHKTRSELRNKKCPETE